MRGHGDEVTIPHLEGADLINKCCTAKAKRASLQGVNAASGSRTG
jgi:hypothetical protein